MLNDGIIVAPAAPLAPVDTTGAGDAFNAGYLAARRCGIPAADAAMFANRLTGCVIGCRGAVLPRAGMPDFAIFVAERG